MKMCDEENKKTHQESALVTGQMLNYSNETLPKLTHIHLCRCNHDSHQYTILIDDTVNIGNTFNIVEREREKNSVNGAP